MTTKSDKDVIGEAWGVKVTIGKGDRMWVHSMVVITADSRRDRGLWSEEEARNEIATHKNWADKDPKVIKVTFKRKTKDQKVVTATTSFSISIGDWSKDGHGMKEDFIALADKPLASIREAYFTARHYNPELNPEQFCNNYGDPTVPGEVVEMADELGFAIDQEDFGPYEMAQYVIWFINLGDPKVNARLDKKALAQPSTLSFYGHDKKKRHISFIGYGLFEG